MSEYLIVKVLAERALFDVGGIPGTYEIKIVLQQSPIKRIIFSNTTDEYRAQKARGEISGGNHLIQTETEISCDLPSLSTLKDVKYLILDYMTIDDLSGLENLGDLIYLSYKNSREGGRNDFTEAEILSIKQMYPACRIMGYPREEPEEQYLIRSLEDYQRLACYVEAGYEDLDVVLVTDLDLGAWPYTFPLYRGHFDGNGHTISNDTKVLIGKLGTGGVVENLKLEQVQITEEEDGTGAIAGYNYGTITGCQVSGHVEGMGYVGGIASINCGLIEVCRNQAEVLSTASGANQKYNSSQMYEGYGAGDNAGYCGTAREEGE